MRLHEWIGLSEHCISEDQEVQQIPSLCTVHAPAFG